MKSSGLCVENSFFFSFEDVKLDGVNPKEMNESYNNLFYRLMYMCIIQMY